nr:unnamed protein product [Callosobruchus analis]
MEQILLVVIITCETCTISSPNHHLFYECFYTVLSQIESILNSRPLCPLSDDPNDFEALTPGYFLFGTRLTSIVEEDVQQITSNRLKLYHQLKQIIQGFWTRWVREYLHTLQARTKWRFDQAPTDLVGSLVILKDENQHPWLWKTGRIIDIYPSSDGRTRVVDVKLPNGVTRRAINKICLLPKDGVFQDLQQYCTSLKDSSSRLAVHGKSGNPATRDLPSRRPTADI